MAEAAEHQLLKSLFHSTLRDFSSLRLYGYAEAERRKFDLSCVIQRDWSRSLVGQVAWGNVAGLDKDLRTLLTDVDSEIQAIVAKDTVQHRRAVHEIVADFRRSGKFPELFRLRVFWLPDGLSASRQEDRDTAAQILKEQIVSDLLLNVLFENLAARDVRMLLVSGGILGLGVAILHYIAVHGFVNITVMVKDLALRSATPAREKLTLLHALGFVGAPDMGAYYEPTAKGRVFLELLRRVREEISAGSLSPELLYLLEQLGCRARPLATIPDDTVVTSDPFVWLVRNLKYSESLWGISWPELTYEHAIRLSVPPSAQE